MLSVGALMALQAALGLAMPDRYRDPDWIRAAWFGTDVVTIALAVPLLLAFHRGAMAGSRRARLVVAGAMALVLMLSNLDAGWVAAGFSARLPRRLIAGFYAVVGVVLATVWLALWSLYVFTGRALPVAPEVFRVVAAVDLTLMVPGLVGGGLLLWSGRPWGFVIAAIAGVQGSLYLIALAAGSLTAVSRGIVAAPGEVPLWATLSVLTTAATVVLLSQATAGSPASSSRARSSPAPVR
jgi:hypothetical protein